MTMDIANQQRSDLKITGHTENHVKNDYNTEVTKPTYKRSFDVAFLMMPDERIQQRQIQKQIRLNENIHEKSITEDISSKHLFLKENSTSPEIFNHHDDRRYSHTTINVRSSSGIYDDSNIILSDTDNNQKSAFTKVSQSRLESPIPSLSPDRLSCQSTSPPICTTPTRSNNLYQNFRPEYQLNGAFQTVSSPSIHPSLLNQNSRIKQHLMFRPMTSPNTTPPEILPGYMSNGIFTFAGPSNPFIPQPDVTGIVRNPAAAAILSTLIPPTLASTFSLTAQNVCAKCNISFRMTSDLVYHMRSHHKSEVSSDPNRRKREEKLKCPVCNESFRERHHLTRHMTAHQDKDSDQNDIDDNHHKQRKK